MTVGKDDATALWSGGFALAYLADEVETGTAHVDRAIVLNPNSAAANFVLGYEYMCLGDLQAAANRFQVVTHLQPSDQLSAAFVKRLTAKSAT